MLHIHSYFWRLPTKKKIIYIFATFKRIYNLFILQSSLKKEENSSNRIMKDLHQDTPDTNNLLQVPFYTLVSKGGFKSEDIGEFLHLQHKYSKSLSWAENLNFPPTTVNNLFKFYAQDSSDLEYLCWRCKNLPVSSDLKPPLVGDIRMMTRTNNCHECYIWKASKRA